MVEFEVMQDTGAREVIVPDNEDMWLDLRTKDVTSTEVSALFGVNPYVTLYELWHRKKEGSYVRLTAHERMRWGTRLQDAIAMGLAEDNGLAIRPMKEYIRNPSLRMGASFDYRIITAVGADDFPDDGIFEIKNVDSIAYKEGWADDENGIEAPPHIELQVQAQLAVSKLKFARIGALVGGNKGALITRVRDEKIIAAIENKVSEFWKSIEDGIEPTPDFSRDAEFIAKLHNFSEPGKKIDTTSDREIDAMVQEYKGCGEIEKQAKSDRAAIKAKLLIKIGDAEKAIGKDFTISASMIGPKHVEYDAAGYRDFRINWKKEKRA